MKAIKGVSNLWVVVCVIMLAFVAVAISGNAYVAIADDGMAFAPSEFKAQSGDSVTSAKTIKLNKTTTNALTSNDDEDWYRVKLPKSGMFQVRFSGSYQDGGGWDVYLKDADNNEMWSGGAYASDFLTKKTLTMHKTGLAAGTYYLVVVHRSYTDSVDSLTYRLTPAFTASKAWETEWNDDVEHPDALAPGKTVSGTLRHGDDEDWYRVKLPKSGMFQVRFSGSYQDGGGWTVYLKDAGNNEMWSGDAYASGFKAGKSLTLYSAKLKAGTYYLVVVHRSYTDSVDSLTYKLTPTYFVSKTAITKTKAGKRAVSVRWKRVSDATSYQMRWSSKKSMKGSKKVTVPKKLLHKKVLKLKSGTKYYVQVRAVKKVGTKNYYSAWSAKKTVTTKKR